ncbi:MULTISPECIES: hypothetical protein [unclassified Aminobacter]|uniref:hypothetical protein n=1 Tax=unclassified Aminobacter TaxID=2644704 RepID=UPI000465D455|nr:MULTISPECIES: hypothetical protein [unclassified Aminobacter]TWH28916.1 hypothetical protein L611_003600000300 [Aminobacter sp. J15]
MVLQIVGGMFVEGFTMEPQLRAAIKDVIVEAIETFGLDRFKQTSLFLSNQRASETVKKAA